MSIIHQFQCAPNALLVDDQERPGFYIAAIEATRQMPTLEAGDVIKSTRSHKNSADIWTINVRCGWLRGFNIEFTQPLTAPGSLTLRIKRTSRFRDMAIIVFGLIPAFLTFVLLLLGKFFLDHGSGPPAVLVAAAITLIGAGLATLLARFVEFLSRSVCCPISAELPTANATIHPQIASLIYMPKFLIQLI